MGCWNMLEYVGFGHVPDENISFGIPRNHMPTEFFRNPGIYQVKHPGHVPDLHNAVPVERQEEFPRQLVKCSHWGDPSWVPISIENAMQGLFSAHGIADLMI